MSLFNSMLGSISPQFRDSFEDPRGQQYELPRYTSPSRGTRIPPPIASTVLWNTPAPEIKAPARVPDDLLALQRRARHLERQLQDLLDAQADGLMSGLAGKDSIQDDLRSNGSITPTVSSVRSSSRSTESEDYVHMPKKKIGLTGARRGIYKRIQQLASIKAEEMDYLNEDLRQLYDIVGQTDTWAKKRARLEKKIQDIQNENNGERVQSLHTEASKLEQEIRQKEEELAQLKTRHRRVLDELSNSENSVEAKLSSYKASLSILDNDVASFLARPPGTSHVPLSTSPFLSLPPRRRTLEMAQDFWHEEHMRLTYKCEEVDVERIALDEGAVLWNDVVTKIVDFESTLQKSMQQAGRGGSPTPTRMLDTMDVTIRFLEEKLEFVKSREWNLLFLAIGAELEAFKQGKAMLEEALGVNKSKKGKEKAEQLVDTADPGLGAENEELSRSAIRITRSSPKPATSPPKRTFFDTDNEDPDPELMISHQDTDTD